MKMKFMQFEPEDKWSCKRSPETIDIYQCSCLTILRKTIEGYGFCFDFIVKGIIFSTQIINRYVAKPSLYKDSIKFSRCLEALLADLQKRWNTPEIEVLTVAYPTQFCHSSPLTDSFNCETVLIIKMPVLLCLNCILGKFQKSAIFG